MMKGKKKSKKSKAGMPTAADLKAVGSHKGSKKY